VSPPAGAYARTRRIRFHRFTPMARGVSPPRGSDQTNALAVRNRNVPAAGPSGSTNPLCRARGKAEDMPTPSRGHCTRRRSVLRPVRSGATWKSTISVKISTPRRTIIRGGKQSVGVPMNREEGSLDHLTDGELLDKVGSGYWQAPFEELFRRHAGMVLGECGRLLADAHEAEDAAQAVFLVLWEKARSLRRQSTVAGWLHRVAWHVCRNAQRAKAVRKTHERRAAESRQESSNENSSCNAQIQDVLDDELEHLPEKYRLPLLLFHLEGRSIEEIGALLRLRAPTVGTRLSRGREILRKRMVRRGIITATSTAALSAAAAPVSATWISMSAQSAPAFAAGRFVQEGLITPQTAALAKGGLRLLNVAKLKLALGAAVTASLSCGGIAALALLMMPSQDSSQTHQQAPQNEHVQAILNERFELARKAALARVRTEKIPKEILEAMRQREAAIVNFDLRWRMHVTKDGRDPSAQAIIALASGHGSDELRATANKWPFNRLLFAGPKCRRETTIVGTHQPSTTAFDGHVLRDWGPGFAAVVGPATPSDVAIDVWADVNLIGPRFVFRPLSQIPQEDRTIAFESETHNVCGRPCVSLRFEDATNPGDQWQCFLDRERHCVPMKLQQRHRGFLAIEVTIPDFAVGAACGPVPTAWLTTLYRRDGSILYEFSSFLEDFRLYKTVPDSEFELSFPPGTTVLPRALPRPKPSVRGPLTRKGPIYKPIADRESRDRGSDG
jgi:RNA polymerase sigma factor (sigma-70 family)